MIKDYIKNNENAFLEELKAFLSIPSISTNPENKADVAKCASFVEAKLKEAGLENVQIFPTKGHPIVYGDWLNAGDDKLTVLIYGHYDVQPVDPIDLWTNPPFEPVLKDGKLYARGSTDDKGQVYIHIKAIQALLQLDKSIPVNIKVLIEGEEEIGSDNLDEFISSKKDLLKCDYVIVSDTAMYEKGAPSICYGLRGLCYMEVNVTGPSKDLHSGSFGGAVDNPINALAHMISSLKDKNGKILIPGFYDKVKDLSQKEREEFARLNFSDEKLKHELNVNKLFGEEGFTTSERKSARPTLDCNGIWGGFQGEGAKTVLPAKAGAKISMRLVPNQDPDEIEKLFTEYIHKLTPDSVTVKVTGSHNAKPAITPIDTPAIKAAVSALKKAYGKEPLFIREGGSIPVVNTFQELLNSPTILLGFGLPDENAHSPDEHFELENFYKGIESIYYYLKELSNLKNG